MLPPASDDEEFHRLDPDIDYLPALRVIAARAGLDEPAAAERFADGSLPVFGTAGRVVKLYPPSCAAGFERERRALELIAGEIAIETPRVLHAGELSGWRYVVMTRLSGLPLRHCMDQIPVGERQRLATALGEAVATLHALDASALPRSRWADELRARAASCVERQAARGLADAWLERIEPFLQRWLPALPTEPTVLLHTEIMREHVLARDDGGRWVLSGLIDFEPSCAGPAEYELSSVGLFFSEGDRTLWRAFLSGLGKDADDELPLRCMAWGLLHRYAHLRWWLQRSTPASPRRSFEDLAAEWFG